MTTPADLPVERTCCIITMEWEARLTSLVEQAASAALGSTDGDVLDLIIEYAHRAVDPLDGKLLPAEAIAAGLNLAVREPWHPKDSRRFNAECSLFEYAKTKIAEVVQG